jgi:hypothetical protein
LFERLMDLFPPRVAVALDSNPDRGRRKPKVVPVAKRTFSDKDLVVHPRTVDAPQVADEDLIVLDRQQAMMPTDPWISQPEIAICGAPDQELG